MECHGMDRGHRYGKGWQVYGDQRPGRTSDWYSLGQIRSGGLLVRGIPLPHSRRGFPHGNCLRRDPQTTHSAACNDAPPTKADRAKRRLFAPFPRPRYADGGLGRGFLQRLSTAHSLHAPSRTLPRSTRGGRKPDYSLPNGTIRPKILTRSPRAASWVTLDLSRRLAR